MEQIILVDFWVSRGKVLTLIIGKVFFFQIHKLDIFDNFGN